jgi:predicted phage terminase large subunit-like protein
VLGAYERVSELKWIFPSGATVMFGHLQAPTSWLDWQGTETAFYGFDQLEEFTQNQFLKILGCMRTTSGAATQLMATMNPDASSWVRKLVDPWIAADGYVDPECDRKIKYFTVEDEIIVWVDADWRDANNQPAISCQYISADIWDNPALLQSDPTYLSSLMTQSFIDRERFLGQRGRGGNWNVKAEAGKVFSSDWFLKVSNFQVQPGDTLVRFWDFASTTATTRAGDYTVDCLMCKRKTNTGDRFFVVDVGRRRLPVAKVNELIRQIAVADGNRVSIRWQQDPGSAGVRDSANLQNILSGFDACGIPDLRDKVSRALPASAAVESGSLQFVLAGWNQFVFTELEQFPDAQYDDVVDTISGAYNTLTASGFFVNKYKH